MSGDDTVAMGRAGDGDGRVLGGRYRLRGLLGSGGMADVELGHDDVLDRDVAIKILHRRYASDPSFRTRFRREAQAAARLNHPNIVGVYDTGEQDGLPYIVMEYVTGRTLREVLQAEELLPSRAVEIASEAAQGLHYAHERGLVHRDIKPANILVSSEGRVKVADFGIARAVDTETVTQTAAVFGTAAYVAPEQARGQQVDPRTDVYALGCVLYEMLAGRQPFDAESAVALAYKHISETPPPPSAFNDDVSPSLDAVVARAMAKDPADRYQTAREMDVDLGRAARGLPVAAPPAAFATTQALRRDETLVAPAPERRPVSPPSEAPQGRRGAGYVILFLLILAAAVAGYFLVQELLTQPQERLVRIPRSIIGQNIGDAQRVLDARGLNAVVGRQVNDDRFGQNEVVATDPEPGTRLPEGSEVTLDYSAGPALVTVPELEGLQEDDAQAAIRDADLSVGRSSSEPSEEIEAGIVLRSDPSGGLDVEEGTRIDYVVSAGPEPYRLPNVVGASEEAAIEELENGCATPPCVRVEVSDAFDPAVGEGLVVSQDPPAGTEVDRGATVVIVVSQGPEPTPEPTEPEPTES